MDSSEEFKALAKPLPPHRSEVNFHNMIAVNQPYMQAKSQL